MVCKGRAHETEMADTSWQHLTAADNTCQGVAAVVLLVDGGQDNTLRHGHAREEVLRRHRPEEYWVNIFNPCST